MYSHREVPLFSVSSTLPNSPGCALRDAAGRCTGGAPDDYNVSIATAFVLEDGDAT